VTTIDVPDVAGAVQAEDDTLEERRMRACAMRFLGLTFAQIAEQQGLSVEMVRRDINRVIRETMKETREEMRGQQRLMLAQVRRAAMPAATTRDHPNRSQSARDVIACLAAEADLCGLKAPIEVSVGVSEQDFAAKMNDLLNQLDPADMKELTDATAVIAGLASPEQSPTDQPEPIDVEVVDDQPSGLVGPDAGSADAPSSVVGPDDGSTDVPPERRRPSGWSNL
jgi:transposase